MSDAVKRTGEFIETAPGAPRAQRSRDDLAPGDFIGPFTIKRRLGEGGMGVVYLAERPDQNV